VTNEVVETTIKLVREVNGILYDERLQLNSFQILETNMTTLDMTPILSTFVDNFVIWENPRLTSIIESGILPPRTNTSKNSKNPDKIHIISLTVRQSPLFLEESFSALFRYCEPTIEWLRVENGGLRGSVVGYPIGDGSGDHEFLPGLSTQALNLQNLNFEGSMIKSIGEYVPVLRHF